MCRSSFDLSPLLRFFLKGVLARAVPKRGDVEKHLENSENQEGYRLSRLRVSWEGDEETLPTYRQVPKYWR
jgi:hypothetical protein